MVNSYMGRNHLLYPIELQGQETSDDQRIYRPSERAFDHTAVAQRISEPDYSVYCPYPWATA